MLGKSKAFTSLCSESSDGHVHVVTASLHVQHDEMRVLDVTHESRRRCQRNVFCLVTVDCRWIGLLLTVAAPTARVVHEKENTRETLRASVAGYVWD